MKLRRRKRDRMGVSPVYWTICAALGALNVTIDLRLWTPPALPLGSSWLAFDLPFTCLCAAMAARGWLSKGSRESRRLIRELAAVAKPMRGGTWLNRDDHLIFQVSRRLRVVWFVARIPEAAAYAAAHSVDERGAPLMFEAFQWGFWLSGVNRDDEMALVALEGDDVVPRKLPGRRGRLRRTGRRLRPSGPLGTSGAARAETVADLIRQLRAAERMDDR